MTQSFAELALGSGMMDMVFSRDSQHGRGLLNNAAGCGILEGFSDTNRLRETYGGLTGNVVQTETREKGEKDDDQNAGD